MNRNEMNLNMNTVLPQGLLGARLFYFFESNQSAGKTQRSIYVKSCPQMALGLRVTRFIFKIDKVNQPTQNNACF